MRIAPPHRLDLGCARWLRLWTSFVSSPAADELDDAVPFLSVRSAFSALLEALALPPGSTVLLSAITIADMPRLVRMHGLVPVAIDVDPHTLAIDMADFEQKLTSDVKAVVIAQLFGARNAIDDVTTRAHAVGAVVIEDNAQAHTTWRARGASPADVVLWSFGTLKTSTVLGGALAEVANPVRRQCMRDIQSRWPAQTATAYAQKIAKTGALLCFQSTLVYGLVAHACRAFGVDMGALVLLLLLHRQPCRALVTALADRLRSDDGNRTLARARDGERLASNVGDAAARRTHWLVGVTVDDPALLRAELLSGGVDASGASNLIGMPECPRATSLIAGLVMIPAYPELSARHRAVALEAVKSAAAR
jgi:perosamine synthetase